jgi:apolipoprotein N-acyltransferase
VKETLALVPALTARRAGWMAAGSGLISGLVFTHPAYGWLLWVAMVPFFLALWSGEWQWRRIWRLCLAWSVPYNVCGLYFLTRLHSLEWRGLSYVQSLIFAYGASWFGVTLLLVPALIAWGYALYRLRPTGAWQFVTPVALWVCMEWAQRHVPLAMPWNLLALPQVSLPPVIQIAAVTGALGVSALVLACNNAIALGLLTGTWRSAAVPVGLAALNAIGGWVYLASQPAPQAGSGVAVALVQGNIRPDVNWQPTAFADMLGTFETLTRKASAQKPKLIVWPESSLPVDVPHTPWLHARLQDLARETGATLAVGALQVRTEDRRLQNCLGFYDPTGAKTPWYYKRHLVPFGEYTPGGAVLKPALLAVGLSAANTLPSDAMPGDWPGPVPVQGLQLGPMICFESIFPDVVSEAVGAGADTLIEATNDAWFKDSVALAQHNGHAALRAVENHRWMVRAAITGISAIIDPYGRTVASAEPNVQAVVHGEVWPRTERTPASRWPDWFVAFGALTAVAGSVSAVAASQRGRRA